ncbi:MAG: hypothetical protein O7J95_02480 [Planctomycetota bacterium]|nr:hypothetical protein [Planctomycetota bacterium]
MFKWIKRSVIGLVALGVVGFFFFGKDVYSYVTSSSRMIKDHVKSSVPFEFELERARHMLDELIPEMRGHLKLIAHEEVEVATLDAEIEEERKSVEKERSRIQALRKTVSDEKVSYKLGAHRYSREQVIDELARRFEHFRTAEILLASKENLLDTREKTLEAAIRKLDKMRVTRVELAAQIGNLESQFHLVQAEASTSNFQLDDSKFAQINRLLKNLRKRLGVAQRMLAHEARFVENIPVDVVDEEALLESIDTHFDSENDGASDTSL